MIVVSPATTTEAEEEDDDDEEEDGTAVAGEHDEDDGLSYYEDYQHHADDANSSFFVPILPSSTTYGAGSERSGASMGSVLTNNSSFYPSSVHRNLMRANPSHRNPMRYYQIVKVLGEGSMGSVAKVKKRDRAKGGSARTQFVKEERDSEAFCFCLPFFGSFANRMRASFDSARNPFLVLVASSDEMSPLANDLSNGSSLQTSGAVGGSSKYSSDGSALSPDSGRCCTKKCDAGRGRKGHMQDAWPSTSTLITHGTKKESYYALKSIHLDRCTNRAYMKELRNEGTMRAVAHGLFP
jgi:hypothetical protein